MKTITVKRCSECYFYSDHKYECGLQEKGDPEIEFDDEKAIPADCPLRDQAVTFKVD